MRAAALVRPPDILPVEDAHLPRDQRRFPSRAATEAEQAEVNRDISDTLRGFDRMMHQALYRQHIRKTHAEFTNAYQRVCIGLWSYSLPRYDRTKSKLSTFLYSAIRNLARGEQQRIRSGAATSERPLADLCDGWMGDGLTSPDYAEDDRVEAAAARIIASPEKYLTVAQVAVFRAVTENPGVQMQDLAKRLGYKKSSFSCAITRIRNRIRAISTEDVDQDRPGPADGGTDV